jgi:hypothetical protein
MLVACGVLLLTTVSFGQSKRLWVLRASGEMVEYDPAAFSAKQSVKLPADAGSSPQSVSVNAVGQILFVPAVSLPLADSDLQSPHKAWLWNGQAASALDLTVKREVATTGSNQAVTDTVATVALSEDGKHLFWFANEQRRLQREEIDLSAATTWRAWQTDLAGAGREDIGSLKLHDCSCSTGACEESCPTGAVWAPAEGLSTFFVMTEVVTGKDELAYKASSVYREQDGKWTGTATSESLRRMLDATSNGDVMVEAIPDTGCCGWSNQSDDQTLVLANGNRTVVFDEQATYKNPDYDVSFYTASAWLSPDLKSVAMTIVGTAQANQPIQLAEQGQANPEESKQIRRALTELPAVEIKSVEEPSPRIAFLPHAVMVGWIKDKELLLVEDHLLVNYNLSTGARRKSAVQVEDAGHVFLR